MIDDGRKKAGDFDIELRRRKISDLTKTGIPTAAKIRLHPEIDELLAKNIRRESQRKA